MFILFEHDHFLSKSLSHLNSYKLRVNCFPSADFLDLFSLTLVFNN